MKSDSLIVYRWAISWNKSLTKYHLYIIYKTESKITWSDHWICLSDSTIKNADRMIFCQFIPGFTNQWNMKQECNSSLYRQLCWKEAMWDDICKNKDGIWHVRKRQVRNKGRLILSPVWLITWSHQNSQGLNVNCKRIWDILRANRSTPAYGVQIVTNTMLKRPL